MTLSLSFLARVNVNLSESGNGYGLDTSEYLPSASGCLKSAPGSAVMLIAWQQSPAPTVYEYADRKATSAHLGPCAGSHNAPPHRDFDENRVQNLSKLNQIGIFNFLPKFC
jgi:hypothetical protein